MSRRDDPQLTVILDRFDKAWAGSAAPEIRDFLPEVSDAFARKTVLIELLMIDLERRWRSGPSEAATLPPDAEQFPAKPTLEDYFARYPELGPFESLPVKIISEEYRVRRGWGDKPGHEEYLQRFPAQSSELQTALAKVDSDASIDATVNLPRTDGPEAMTLPPETSGTIAHPAAGDRVRYFGEYELLDEIARGGMGVVFKARQVKLNRIVALKMILSGGLAGEEEVRRFKTEAEAAANLDHPGIVPIYEIGEHQGQHYFSMGLVEGQSLADRVKDGPLPPKEAAEIVRKVAEAVAYAHEKGVIHRDLKPANVLLDANGEPKVTDFGLAKQVESDSYLTRTGAVMGTPSYMPPEQAGGKTSEVGPRSDVYSLGAILYCLLTGRPPFQSANPMDILMQVLEKEPVSSQSLNAAIPTDLDTVCLKCLQKDAIRRYETADEVSAELVRFLRGEPIVARPISRIERGWRWCQRNPLVAGLVAGMVILLITGTAVSSHFALLAKGEAALARKNEEQARQETLLARRNLYVARMNLAQRAYDGSDLKEVVRLLSTQLPEQTGEIDLRSFEWYYLWRLCHAERLSFEPLDDPVENLVNSLAFAHDGLRLAVAAGYENAPTGELTLWNPISGKKLTGFSGHQQSVEAVSFSTDGRLLASGDYEGMLRMWDARTAKLLFTCRADPTSLSSVQFDPRGARLLSGGWKESIVWRISDSQQLIKQRDLADLRRPVFSSDGNWIVGVRWTHSSPKASDDQLRDGQGAVVVVDARTLKETRVFDLESNVAADLVAFSGNTKRICASTFASNGAQAALVIWNWPEGKRVVSIPIQDVRPRCISFSPDGRLVASTNGKGISLWDVETGKERSFLPGEFRAVFAPLGDVLATSDFKRVKIWDFGGNANVRILDGLIGPPRQVAVSPDGQTIGAVSSIAGNSGNAFLWDLSAEVTRTELIGTPPSRNSILSDPSNLADVLRATDSQNPQDMDKLRDRLLAPLAIAYGGAGKWVALAVASSKIDIFDVRSREKIRTLESHADTISDVAFSRDERWFVSASRDGVVKLWDTATWDETISVNKGNQSPFEAVAVSADASHIAAVTRYGKGTFWDRRGKQTGTFAGVAALDFRADGEQMVTIGHNQSAIKVLSVLSGDEVLELRGHSLKVNDAVFSPDGKRIASAGMDGTVRLWDSETGEEVFRLAVTAPTSVAFDRTGLQLVVGSSEGVLVYDASSSIKK